LLIIFLFLFALDSSQSASLGNTRKDDTFVRDGDAASADGGGGGALLPPLSSEEPANSTEEQGEKSYRCPTPFD
jgi:hypothetical protein